MTCRQGRGRFALFVFMLTASAWVMAQSVPEIEDYPGEPTLIYYGWDNSDPPRLRVQLGDKFFWVFKGVVKPTIHGAQMLEVMKIRPGEEVLEIGAGSGALSIYAAAKASRVVATDISAKAVENIRYNVERHAVDHVVSVREGDLFAPIAGDEQFDVILFNVVYPYNEQTQHFWRLHERFFSNVRKFLKPNGRIYYQNGFFFNIEKVLSMIEENQLSFVTMDMMNVPKYGRQPFVMMLQTKAGIN